MRKEGSSAQLDAFDVLMTLLLEFKGLTGLELIQDKQTDTEAIGRLIAFLEGGPKVVRLRAFMSGVALSLGRARKTGLTSVTARFLADDALGEAMVLALAMGKNT